MMAVFDTNILIDYLNGHEKARTTINQYAPAAISRITWMEVLAGAAHKETEHVVRAFLAQFILIEIDARISEAAVRLRAERRLRLPDAIILASAREHGCLLITRNTKDFKPTWPEIRVPYP